MTKLCFPWGRLRPATAVAPGLLLFLLAACVEDDSRRAAVPPPDIAAPPAASAKTPGPPPRKPAAPSGPVARLPPASDLPETEAPATTPAPPQSEPPAPEPAARAPDTPPPRLPDTAPSRPPEPLPPPRASGSFDRLIGLDQAHMVALLGAPRQRAESAPATIWRYIGRQCELDVYFYLDLQSQTLRALHYEVRNHESPERPAQPCYDELVGERHAGAEPGVGKDSPH